MERRRAKPRRARDGEQYDLLLERSKARGYEIQASEAARQAKINDQQTQTMIERLTRIINYVRANIDSLDKRRVDIVMLANGSLSGDGAQHEGGGHND